MKLLEGPMMTQQRVNGLPSISATGPIRIYNSLLKPSRTEKRRKSIVLTRKDCQVVSLGAGYDTLFWTLSDAGCAPRVWIDVDFEQVTAAKVYLIRNRRQLHEKLLSPEYSRCELHSGAYHVISADLRNASELIDKLDSLSLNRSTPTLFIAECVLVYLPAIDSSSLLTALATHYSTVFFVNYEQVNMTDRFGQVMLDNLQHRGCGLAGVDHCASLETQKARFRSSGWSHCEAIDMMAVYHSLPQDDVQRIEKIEMLDDYEMLAQLFEHYCVTWAYNDPQTLGLSSVGLTMTR